MYDNFPMSKVI